MHVSGVSLDLNWFLQLILTVFFLVFGLLHLVKNTASKYFEVDANFETAGGEGERGRQGRAGEVSDRTSSMSGFMDDAICIVCRNSGSKKCSRCKSVRYCSQKCQEVHWKSGHKTECKELQSSSKVNSTATVIINKGVKGSTLGSKTYTSIALVPARGTSKPVKSPKDVLFPYDEFVKLFYWDKHQFPPCGLLNCGNSCFANVVLQCLTFTRPLVAHLLEKGHRTECIRDDWCFLCEFQTHVERASQSVQSFSPNNIISRLPNIGGNLGYGRQEDAHEFMRFAIDTMQLVCLDEFGGEKAVPPQLQETTIIQHIYGGHLQSQVICNNCNNISNQYENMMDLTVEIHGGAASLEECLDLFTAMEWLHGDNMYKCDGCNNYVRASKRLTVKQAPNILTIALKRFQSGRFGKLNKKVTFPETLNLRPYMSKAGDDTNIYKLYAVVVHVDVLNASFFGHYICYIKDLSGNWYRIDDCKVVSVELDEVLSQGAYMILYSRVCPRPSSLQTDSKKDGPKVVSMAKEACPKQQNDFLSCVDSLDDPMCSSGLHKINGSLQSYASNIGIESSESHPESLSAQLEDTDMADIDSSTPKAVSKHEKSSEGGRENADEMDLFLSSNGTVREISEDIDLVISQPSSSKEEVNEIKVYGNGHLHASEITSLVDNTNKLSSNNNNVILMSKTSAVEAHQTKCGSPRSNGSLEDGNGVKRVELRCDE